MIINEPIETVSVPGSACTADRAGQFVDTAR